MYHVDDGPPVDFNEYSYGVGEDHQYYELFNRVEVFLYQLPDYFEIDYHVPPTNVTDLFNFNGIISTSLERQVIDTLNSNRDEWDPMNEFSNFSFSHRSQQFPDIVLENDETGEVVQGIELKSWYLVSKEKEPSFRFKVSPDACREQDLLVVYPWVFSGLFSGSPILKSPFVTYCKKASHYMDYYWKEKRDTEFETAIKRPEDISPYPKSKEKINDVPVEDPGYNYGRLSRSGIMDDYIETVLDERILGIQIRELVNFLNNYN